MENAAGAELLSPAEADWPPELRLPPPPPPAEPPPAPAVGMDDSQFLGSIMGEDPPARQVAAEAAPVGAKRKRGRPPKKRDGAAVVAAAAKPARSRREDEEEVVCFICFDGGNLVVCDRRGCPKVYHPACIKRDEAFFQSRSKWNCGWHICSSCEKAVHYMCYTCTYSLCKLCIKQGKFFSVRGAKGFCDTCFGTILLIESKDQGDIKVDFDDINSWEYLFKLYWLDLKGKLSLTLEELTSAKNRWNVPNTSDRKEKEESSDDLYDINNDDDAGSDCSLGRQRRTDSSRKKGRKRQKVNSDCSIAAKKIEPATRDYGSLPTKVPSEGISLPIDTKWASPELLEFIGHMRDGDQSYISQFDVQTLLLEYIKKNNLRDPQRKSQIVCDTRLQRLFRKTRVAHFEMLKLLEMHFLTNETSRINDDSQGAVNSSSAQIDTDGYSDMAAKLSPDKRRMHRKMEREPQVNLEAYAAIDMHNINLIYMRRSLMEDLIDDATFSDKIHGAFVKIKISGVGQKQDMYRLVKVIGTHKVPEKYSTGKKMTNLALEILNLNKKEIITMDTISNQDFTEEECKRLRQSMKYGLISRLKVGDIQEKAKIFRSVRVNDWLENEKQRLGHLRDRASETGRRKELRECVEKLQLLNKSEERTRRINEVPEVHVDLHMDPNYESDEEMDDQKAVGRSVNWTRSDTSISRRKSKYTKVMQNHTLKISDASHHPKKLSTESTTQGSGAGRAFENFHSTNGTDIPKSSTKVNSTIYEEAGSLSSSGVTMSSEAEPEKVWHYKDPSGNVQGPFTLLQLSKWTSYFPRDLRVWLTFESEERSLLLTEVLSKQQKDFTQAASVTTSSKATSAGTGHNRNSPSVDQNNALSPVGYSMVNSSGITVQSNKYSIPERESVNSPDDSLSFSTSSVPPKDAHTSSSQVQYQTNHSAFIQSRGSPFGQTDLHHDGVQGGCSGESNHRHSSGALWSPTTAQMSCSGQGNVDSHDNQHASWSQSQHVSKNSSQGGSVKDLNSRLDVSKNLPTQRIGRDGPSPVFAWSPSESRTASSQHEGSCLSSTTNPSLLDELHSSMASVKPKSCVPATPVEDRGSSSPSGMLSHSERVPNCSPQSAPSASASDVFKLEEIMNQQRTLEADTSNASVNQSPQSKIFPVSSPDNQDIDRELPSPTPRSENKEPAVDNSRLTPASPSPVSDTCKMDDIVNQQKLLEADASNSSANHSPQSKVSPVGSHNEDLEHEYPSSSPRSENKEPAVDDSLLTSAAPEKLTITSASASDTCKMGEIVYQQKNLEADASNASLNQPPQSNISPVSSPDNQDTECEYPSPTPRSENKEPLVDNSGLKSAAPENLAATSASASDTCKMEILNKKRTLETDASDGFIIQSPKSKVFLVSSPDDLDIEHEFPSPTPRSENKEPAVDNSGLTSAVPENVTNVPGDSPDASVSLKSGPATGELGATESGFRGEEEIIQKELYSESTAVTRENMVINASCVAESIDVSDVLESLIEQRCGTLYMHGTTAVEDLLAASAEEEPQCSSPIALSPWGEPSYYQGDAVDSALWGVQDDLISDMWSLLSPTPTLQPSSGIGAEGSDTRDISEVAVAHGNSETFQRGPTPGEENANQAISGAATDWVLPEQVTSKPNDVSISSVDESTGVLGWQPSADQSLYAGTEWSTSQNLYLSTCEKAAPSSKSSWEASRKQECTDSSVSSSGEAIGNTNKGCNPPSRSANRGSHRSHHRDRYSQISESWLLSSNYSSSRSDRFGTGGSSRSTSKGQTRGVCKFHESGHCRKGASCSYLHP